MKKPNNAKAAKKAAPAAKRAPPKASPAKAAAKASAKSDAKGAKPPKQTRAEKADKRKAAAHAAVNSNSADPKLRAIFLDSLPKYDRLKKQLASVNGQLRAFLKDSLRDGFTKDQFETANLVSTPEGEKKLREKIGKQLQAAQFVGSMLGTQLDFFNEPDRTPAVDIARSEGERDSMTGKPRKCDYHPSVPQYAAYMEGFDSHQKQLQLQVGRGQIAGSGAESDADADDEPDGDMPAPQDTQETGDGKQVH